jgi:hypothetical protein
MTVHVDLVQNEWLAGKQTRLARFAVVDGRPVVDNFAGVVQSELDYLLTGPDPAEDPAGFLEGLQYRCCGTYVFATAPHDDDACVFGGGA